MLPLLPTAIDRLRRITPLKGAFFLLLPALCLLQCRTGKSLPAQESAIVEDATQTEDYGESLYPSIPVETIQMLVDSCDYIDFLFYYKDFSMGQDTPSSIRHTLAGISTTPAKIDSSCKSAGRIYFMRKGETVLEGEMFLEPNCAYYIFYANGERAYANYLNRIGLEFYENVFEEVQRQ